MLGAFLLLVQSAGVDQEVRATAGLEAGATFVFDAMVIG
jgi:hypothetical protein